MAAALPPLDSPEWKDNGSGLKIWDVTPGEGTPVAKGATVKVHYTGWLTNGSVFDSSVASGQPISFSLNSVIKGWTDGIPGMKPGGVRRLMIPANQGYGDRGYPPVIPGGSTLIFEVQLLK